MNGGNSSDAILDLNECLEGNGGCEQLCIDEPAGFHCGCRQGYR